ncbi:hypothetical protein CPB83DRAFT_846963 [Crepidotus variabilis]|uniref:F-box domain-containing protein n=1 Tax=Crepidotus variabilis TaxID=179855 RepID=A0A9P6JU71_9AGAR|nr:hypothetical protein CPB83DRAFT_846963 [Crepidotus variabilis]
MSTENRFFHLAPEISSLIADHLPLHATPSTLLSLALTSRNISDAILPMIHTRLVLKNETEAICVLQKIADDPSFGRGVRELHVLSSLSVEIRKQKPSKDVIRRIEDVILKGHLPLIHTLGIHLTKGWFYDDDNKFKPIKGFGQLSKKFWVKLREKCPRLRTLAMKGFADDLRKSWMGKSGFLEVSGITNLTVHTLALKQSACSKLLNHLPSLAPRLHTLNLKPNPETPTSLASILKLDFPCLRSLSLVSFKDVDSELTIPFFLRHPSVEYLNIASDSLSYRSWFISEIPGDILPNLHYLTVNYKDALKFAPILRQLISLSIHNSVNLQIPYLLREILPDGVPNLKSLVIGQTPETPCMKQKSNRSHRWYEAKDGTFQQGDRDKAHKTVFDGFMHSIVRAAPNLEEIAFYCQFSLLDCLSKMTEDLNGFPNLKRLYYSGPLHSSIEMVPNEELDMFAKEATALVRAVPSLDSVTHAGISYLPYLTARTKRGEDGEVVGVDVGKGYGMVVGFDEEAFPWAPEDP